MLSSLLVTLVILSCTPSNVAFQITPPSLKGMSKNKIATPIIAPELAVQQELSDPMKWLSSMQETAYLAQSKKKGLIPLSVDKDKISFLGGGDLECVLLEGLDSSARVNLDSLGGAFISFNFPDVLSQHDATMGRISSVAKLLAHSRIKRWWMAPNFLDDADDIPVETQLILLEIPSSSSESNYSSTNNSYRKQKSETKAGKINKNQQTSVDVIDASDLKGAKLKLFSDKSFSQKKYAIIAPLIDFNSGFRTTFFGGKTGGAPAGKGVIAARIESGDPDVCTNRVENAVYVAAGNDPYELLEIAYASISKKMGTFRTRKQKLIPPGIDSFGFCTWDAFYSSVDSDKVSSGLDSLRDAGVTVKYVILDDGWQSTALSSKGKDQDKDKDKSRAVKDKKLLKSSTRTSNTKTQGDLVEHSSDHDSNDAHKKADNAVVLVGKHADTEEDDGELSGAQIDGNLAAQKMLEKETSVIVQFLTQALSGFYTKYVEQGAPNSWPVKLWAGLSQNTILKEKLIEFFDSQTDFSKRLTSWKANSKFENPAKGKTLKGFVKNLKEVKGIDYVFVWHALSGYWGGVSTDLRDDMTSALSDMNPLSSPFQLMRNNRDIAAGAIVGGSLATTGSTDSTVENVTAPVRFPRIKKLWSRITSAIRPMKIKVSIQENLPTGLFKGGLLQLSQRIRALTNGTDASVAVKRSYSRPTPHLLLVEPALAWDPSALVGVGSVAVNKLEEMYYRMHTYLADAGIDGVKVDAQSGIGAFGVGNGGGSTIAQACVRAVENSAKSAFASGRKFKFSETITPLNMQLLNPVSTLGSVVRKGREVLGLSTQKRAQEVDQGGLLNDSPLALTGCMCHSTENLLNYYETSMVRASDDFYPKDMAAQTVHLVSCAYNTVMLGEIATPDWDMFHSKHPFAGMHAAARAISGGPVYVSDSPGNHDADLLARLVLPNGGILRAQIPARPTVDCLFSDVQRDGVTAMKLWSMNKVGAVAGIFNVQGSSWDRRQRRYSQYTPTIMLPVLTAELRARDIGGSFSENAEGTDTLAEGKKDKGETGDKNMLEMFAAWSSMEKQLTILNSRNDGMKFEVQPKGWDVVSMSRILMVPGTAPKLKSRRPLVQLKNLFGRLNTKNNLNKATVSTSVQSSNEGEEGSILAGNTPGMKSKIASTKPQENTNNSDQGAAIYWSPIGLLDMLNTGGAVEQILSTKTSRAATFLAKGPGRFGVFTTQRPKQVTVDGVVYDFTYEPLLEESEHHNIILRDGNGIGINVNLNINPEEMIKEFMLKMGEMSDEVQTFINDASNEYADMLGNLKFKPSSGSIKQKIKGGVVSFMLKTATDAPGSVPVPPPSPQTISLSGIQKVAISW